MQKGDGVSDVGFYYMANAMGRLIGTILSGLDISNGRFVCVFSRYLVRVTAITAISLRLPKGAANVSCMILIRKS